MFHQKCLCFVVGGVVFFFFFTHTLAHSNFASPRARAVRGYVVYEMRKICCAGISSSNDEFPPIFIIHSSVLAKRKEKLVHLLFTRYTMYTPGQPSLFVYIFESFICGIFMEEMKVLFEYSGFHRIHFEHSVAFVLEMPTESRGTHSRETLCNG